MDVAIDLPRLVQSYFVLLTVGIFGGSLIAPLRERLYAYGARTSAPADAKPAEASSWSDGLSLIPAVPHAWFEHFYVLSIASSLFWIYQMVWDGGVVTSLATIAGAATATMTVHQVYLVLALMLLQGARRLYECVMINQRSTATMGLPHYIFGLAFYAGVGVAIWIEHLPTTSSPQTETLAPTKTVLGVSAFIGASIAQHMCHRHLARLKKYTMPRHVLFRHVVCPHYTSECLIYLSLAIIAAPPGHWVNQTLSTVVLLVFVNLAITADGTRKWYVTKFGPDAAGRKRMIPFVY